MPCFVVAPVSCHLDDGLYGPTAPGGQTAAGSFESGGDIQATTKVVDCRSLKSSPPKIHVCHMAANPARPSSRVNLERAVEASMFMTMGRIV